MHKHEAIQILWDYNALETSLEEADVIIALGNHDLKTAEHASDLYLQGYAPKVLMTGCGRKHERDLVRNLKIESEAQMFFKVAQNKGVPEEDILLEEYAQNTGENFIFSQKVLEERGVPHNRVIVVTKPYMKRRGYATARARLPQAKVFVSSVGLSLKEYMQILPKGIEEDTFINIMVGDYQRVDIYSKKGYMIPQPHSAKAEEAFKFLVSLGYDKNLVMD